VPAVLVKAIKAQQALTEALQSENSRFKVRHGSPAKHDLSGLAPGVYFHCIDSNQSQATLKVFKKTGRLIPTGNTLGQFCQGCMVKGFCWDQTGRRG
jgi:hypothetical protein